MRIEGAPDGAGPRDAAPASPWRVLIYRINYAPEPIGVGRYSGEIGAYLTGQGVKVEVVTAIPHYPGWSVRSGYCNRFMVENDGRIRINRCPILLGREIRGIWRLLAPLSFAVTSAPVALWRILAFRPDVVLCVEPTLLAAPAALTAAWLMGARTVLHVQDLEVDAAFAVHHLRGKFLRKLALGLERFILRRFDDVITISNRMRERLAQKGVSLARITLVRNWVDLEKIRPLADVSGYRAELGIPPNKFIALYAGNVGVKQALPVVFEAAARLVDNPSILFVIVGDGPEKPHLLERFGHLSNVRFLPVQPEERLCELLNLASVHLLPQDAGAADLVLPSKLGGMLASGKPCIVMADPGTELHEFVSDSATMLRPGDYAQLIDAILSIHQKGPSKSDANVLVRARAFDSCQNLSAFRTALCFNANSIQKAG